MNNTINLSEKLMKKVWRIFTTIVLCLLIFSCNENAKTGEKEENNEILTVKVDTVTESTYNDDLEFSGTCFANREANVGSSLPGKVEKIHYHTGQNVKQGSLLVSMSSEMLILSEVEYRTLEKDFERVSRLKDKGSISEQDYDHVRAKYEAAKAKYELVKKNTQILAPFDGVVADIIVQEGENFMFAPSLDLNFSMTSGIVKLMQINPLIIRFPVNERLISQVKTGTPVTIKSNAWPDRNFSGKISLINPKFNTLSRSTDVEIVVPNQSGDLKPGMSVKVKLKGMDKAGCKIPLSSVVTRKDKEFVWVVQENKAHLTEIQRVAMKNDEAIVTGIEPGTIVIVSRKSQLTEGLPVRISKQ